MSELELIEFCLVCVMFTLGLIIVFLSMGISYIFGFVLFAVLFGSFMIYCGSEGW